MTKEEVIEILERFVLGAKPCSQREIVDACASAYGMLKEQSSLPSDLDEAANNYGVDIRLGYPRIMDETDKYIYNAFKAGAEWMAGQGVTTEQVVGRTPLNGPNGITVFLYDFDGFKAGDEVIVQIRKK